MRLKLLWPLLVFVLFPGCFQVALEQGKDLTANSINGAGTALTFEEAQPLSPLAAKTEAPLPDPGITTVNNPEANRRPICLAECVCLALENGRTGEFFDRAGSDRKTSVSGLQRQGLPSNATDNLRVFAFDPAIAGTETEQSLARFDVLWQNSTTWTHVDNPPGLDPGSVPIVGPLEQLIDNLGMRSSLVKPLATGGVAGITVRDDYTRGFLPNGSPILSPANVVGVEFTFEQPLLQGGGVLINQLREIFPVSQLLPLGTTVLPQAGRVPGILLARISQEESRLEFERRVQELLFVVAEAYWDLYYAYWDLYSRESGMRLTQLAWQMTKQKFEAGGAAIEELAQIEEQYHQFRSQRLESLGNGTSGRPGVLEAERRLRYVTGMPGEDGTRLIPTDAPMTGPVSLDWQQAVREAKDRRPELLQIQKEIQAAQLYAQRTKDYLRPDLRFLSRYGINDLSGQPGNGLGSISRGPFSNWELGLQFQMPIGFRAGNAEVTRANFQLAQRYAFLRDQEEKVLLSLQRSYREVVQFREELQTRASQRAAAALQLRARYEKFKAGKESVDLLVRTQRIWADALRDEHNAVSKYNVALADFERQRGTIMETLNVTIADGPVPLAVHENASSHIRQQHQTLVKQATLVPPTPGEATARLADPIQTTELLENRHLQIWNCLQSDEDLPELTPRVIR